MSSKVFHRCETWLSSGNHKGCSILIDFHTHHPIQGALGHRRFPFSCLYTVYIYVFKLQLSLVIFYIFLFSFFLHFSTNPIKNLKLWIDSNSYYMCGQIYLQSFYLHCHWAMWLPWVTCSFNIMKMGAAGAVNAH